jgi:undecaprenyl diphosphate synthase
MKIPKSIGIIMDGNGRWANQRHRPRIFGHIKGARVAKKIISACAESGVHALTLFAFSTENWLRPKQEVDFLFKLLHKNLLRERSNLVKQNIRLKVIGDLAGLPEQIVPTILKCEADTRENTGMLLTFAINYGSKWEITQAARRLAMLATQGKIKPELIDEEEFANQLTTKGIPDPDLIIRTSGEQRLSNFLLWQAAYSEFCFTKTLWPDFNENELRQILSEYAGRQRRFGNADANALTLT